MRPPGLLGLEADGVRVLRFTAGFTELGHAAGMKRYGAVAGEGSGR